MTEPAPPSIESRIARGLSWVAGGRIGAELLRVVTGFALARLMTPEEFGLVGMVTVIANYAYVVLDFGFGSAIVQRKEIGQADLSTIFWINLAMGVAFTALFAATAGWVAAFYGRPELEAIAAVLAVNFVVLPLGFVQRRLLERKLAFSVLARIEVVAAVVSGAVALAVALEGGRSWSLVAWTLSRSAVTTLGTWLTNRWVPSLTFTARTIGELWRFAGSVFASESLSYLGANLDRLLVGRFLGAEAVGLYEQAMRLMLVPVTNTAGVLTRVLFPSLSRLQDDPERIAEIYLRGARIALFVSAPICIGLAAAARPFVALTYGPGWEELVPLLRITGMIGLAATVNALLPSVFRSRGQAGAEFRLIVVMRAITVLATLPGLWLGIVEVTFGRLVASVLTLLVSQVAISRVVPAGSGRQVQNLVRGLVCALAMFGIVSGVDSLLARAGWHDAVCMVVDFVVGAVAYVVVALLVREPALREIRQFAGGWSTRRR